MFIRLHCLQSHRSTRECFQNDTALAQFSDDVLDFWFVLTGPRQCCVAMTQLNSTLREALPYTPVYMPCHHVTLPICHHTYAPVYCHHMPLHMCVQVMQVVGCVYVHGGACCMYTGCGCGCAGHSSSLWFVMVYGACGCMHHSGLLCVHGGVYMVLSACAYSRCVSIVLACRHSAVCMFVCSCVCAHHSGTL